MFTIQPSPLSGCFEIQPQVMDDSRGRFVKVFHQDAFSKANMQTYFAEEYYSHSRRGVIRGLHFQTPPHDHVKMVYCVQGEVFDVVLDLRVGSPTYGKSATFCLNAEKANFLYIPKGMAHGFCATSELATLIYKVSTSYAPNNDFGILWSSIDVDWPTKSPILSNRDTTFPALADFLSPFHYE